jgi:hypothetical protein
MICHLYDVQKVLLLPALVLLVHQSTLARGQNGDSRDLLDFPEFESDCNRTTVQQQEWSFIDDEYRDEGKFYGLPTRTIPHLILCPIGMQIGCLSDYLSNLLSDIINPYSRNC